MASYTISPIWGAGAQLFDNNGDPLSGGKIYVYFAGTTTPATTYTEPTGTFANTNPIIANAAGRLANEIWLPINQAYKFILKDVNETLIATYDNIPTLPQPPIVNDASSISFNAGYLVTAGAFTVGSTYQIASVGSTNFVSIGATSNTIGTLFIATGPGAGTGTAYYIRTVQSKLQDVFSVKDFGAVGNGVTDDSAAFASAILAAAGKPIVLSGGTYRVDTLASSLITDSVNIEGNGTLDGNNNANSYFNIGSSIPLFRLANITMQNMRAAAQASSTAHVIDRVEIENTIVKNSQTGYDFNCIVSSAEVRGNVFSNLSSSNDVNAVRFGNNSWSTQAQQDYAIYANSFDTLEKTSNNGECHAILAYGKHIRIFGNRVENVQNTGNGLGAEGIYIKALEAVVSGNTLVDAGTGEAYINLKGEDANTRRTVCSSNTLMCSSVVPTTGINISTDQVIVSNNYLENMGNYGIRCPRVNIIDAVVQGNTIKNSVNVAIMWEGYGQNVSINDNVIDGVTGQYGGGLAAGIYIHNENNVVGNNIDALSIKGNSIRIPTNSAATHLSGVHVRTLSNQIYARVDVQDNTIEVDGSATNIRDVWVQNEGTMVTVNVDGSQSPNVTKSFDVTGAATITTLNVEWSGTGSPEAQVFASPGSLWRRTDGGAGTSLYVKQSAVTLNTGWSGK